MSASRAGPRFFCCAASISRAFGRAARPIRARTAKTGEKSLKKAAKGLGDDGTLAYSAHAGQVRR
jgi:hypothetical protein